MRRVEAGGILISEKIHFNPRIRRGMRRSDFRDGFFQSHDIFQSTHSAGNATIPREGKMTEINVATKYFNPRIPQGMRRQHGNHAFVIISIHAFRRECDDYYSSREF